MLAVKRRLAKHNIPGLVANLEHILRVEHNQLGQCIELIDRLPLQIPHYRRVITGARKTRGTVGKLITQCVRCLSGLGIIIFHQIRVVVVLIDSPRLVLRLQKVFVLALVDDYVNYLVELGHDAENIFAVCIGARANQVCSDRLVFQFVLSLLSLVIRSEPVQRVQVYGGDLCKRGQFLNRLRLELGFLKEMSFQLTEGPVRNGRY